MKMYVKIGVIGLLMMTVGLVACGGGGGACKDAASGCTMPLNATVTARCVEEHGEGWEARVCEDGTGAECQELETFGTSRNCVGVSVVCCPTEEISAP